MIIVSKWSGIIIDRSVRHLPVDSPLGESYPPCEVRRHPLYYDTLYYTMVYYNIL